jgi:hypothetical protein
MAARGTRKAAMTPFQVELTEAGGAKKKGHRVAVVLGAVGVLLLAVFVWRDLASSPEEPEAVAPAVARGAVVRTSAADAGASAPSSK